MTARDDSETPTGGRRVPLSEPPPPSGPVSQVFVRLLPYGDVSSTDAPPSSRPSGRLSDMPPPSGPVSGVAAPILFRDNNGPGFWIRGPEANVEVRMIDTAFAPCKIIRLAPNGAWFVPERGVQYPLDEPLEISLHAGEREIGPLRAEVVAPPSLVHDPIYGLSFREVPHRIAREIVRLLRDLASNGTARLAHRSPQVREEVRDPSRIRSIVRALSGVDGQGFVGGRRETPMRIASYDEPGRLILWDGTAEWGEEPYFIDIEGYNSVYRLHFGSVTAAGEGHALTSVPTRIERIRHRQHRRGDAEGHLTASFYHPLWPRMAQIKRVVRDVSFGGISFTTSLDDDLLFPGLMLPLIEIRDARTGDLVRLKGEVRAVDQIGEEGVARMSVTHYSWRDESRWNRLIARTLYPTTQGGEERVEDVWDLYKESGYFNLSGKAPEQFDPLKQSYEKVDIQGASVPGLFCHAVFPSERGIEATVSMMRVYRSTWMLHQIAKRRGAPRRILRDVYTRAFEAARFDPGLGFVVSYMDAHVPWNKLSHFAFASRHVESGNAVVLPFHFWEVNTSDRAPYVPHPPEVTPATPREIATLFRHIRQSRPDCYSDALDFVPEQVDLSSVARKWNQAGFRRERNVLVARRGNTPVAAAIVECGETGANLFRLVDNMRLFALEPGGDGAFVSLMSAARAWFRERDKEAFAYFQEDEDPGPLEAGRLRDLGDGCLWIIAAALLQDFLDHVFEVSSQPSKQPSK